MQTAPEQMNILELAYLGDALYELYVRKYVLRTAKAPRADLLHKEGVRFVCAGGQASALLEMMENGFLSEKEADFVRRAHNHKTATKPKNADPVTYKWATAFEALLGYLKLSGDLQRMEEIMQRAVEITERQKEEDA